MVFTLCYKALINMERDKFKNSPIHDKSEIIRMLDELTPNEMNLVVQYIINIKTETPIPTLCNCKEYGVNNTTNKCINCGRDWVD